VRRLTLPFYVLIAFLSLLALITTYESDANFVLYRIATNFAAGRGLLYGTDTAAVSAYPLIPVLLGVAIRLGADISAVGFGIAAGALGVGAYYLHRLAGDRLLVGLAYVAALLIQPSPIAMTTLALTLGGLWAMQNGRFGVAGGLIGAAITASPSAILPAILALIPAAAAGWPQVQRYAFPAALIPLIALGGTAAFAAPGGAILRAPTPGAFGLLLGSVALCGGVFWALRRADSGFALRPYTLILIGWAAAAVMAAFGGRTFPDVALVPGAVMLAFALPGLTRVVIVAALIADVLLGAGFKAPFFNQMDSPEVAGMWLAQNTAPDARIATRLTGSLAYFALPRPIIDMGGSVAPVPVDRFFMFRYAPDVVVLREGEQVGWEGFATTYAQTFRDDNLTVYSRVVDWSEVDTFGVDVNLSAQFARDDLRLVGVGVGRVLKPGQLARVRLDWMLKYRPAFSTEIKLDILRADGQSVVGSLDRLPPEAWETGAFSTYHLIPLPSDAQPGPVALYVRISVRAGYMGPLLRVAEMELIK